MLQTSLLGLFFGTIGTTIGGIIGIFTKQKSNKLLSLVLAFASGLMLAVVCFSLIPESLDLSTTSITICGILLGIITMIVCEQIVNKKINNSTILEKQNSKQNTELLKTGVVVGIGLALHNIPEGLAIGSGFEASKTLGLSLAIAICLHDIPEGISMAMPLKSGGMNSFKIIIYVILSGLATGVGAFLGAVIGNISQEIIAISLAFAAGAMLYMVSGELIPEYNKLHNGKISSLGNMIGFVIGMFVMLIS